MIDKGVRYRTPRPASLNRADVVLRLLTNKGTRTIIEFLQKFGEQRVEAICWSLRIEQPSVSQSLRKMHHAKIVELRLAGKNAFYRLNEQKLARLREIAATIQSEF